VIGDHVYLKLGHAELVDVVDALHLSGKVALEQRLLAILRTMRVVPKSARHETSGASTAPVARDRGRGLSDISSARATF
jgi:hypothetical protein